jgi:uncharacterized protein with ParB-like and HNH nuclease domain
MDNILNKSLVLVVALLLVPAAYAEDGKMNILQVFDQFVMANKAATKCMIIDEEKLSSFNKNFSAVRLRASEQIQSLKPEWSEKEAASILNKRSQDLDRNVEKVIEDNGCSDRRIEDLLERFEMQAGLKFG